MNISQVVSYIDETLDQSLERLFTLLRFESVSTDPAFHNECVSAASWLSDQLTEIGFQSDVMETGGKPMVLAKRLKPGKPHLLFYGHYDVQPADPLEKWATPPFSPVLENTAQNGKVIRARGASDDKGQLMTFLEAARAYIALYDDLPVSLTILLEGEEETGSPSLEPFLEKHKEELKADIVLVCDTNGFDRNTPSITTRLRGLATAEVKIIGPSRDLHSGYYGGAVPNPLHIAGRLISALHNEKGEVQVPEFYADITPLPNALKTQWASLGFNEAGFLGDIGLDGSIGEEGYSLLERIWSRPTAEVNGVYGGYTGEGTKTVIASEAVIKLSFRLVPGQNAMKVLENFQSFARAQMPQGVQISFSHLRGSEAVELDVTSPTFIAAGKALEDEYGKPAALIGMGGSIPIIQRFKDALGMEALMVGFACEDDNIHSPNEKYNLESYRRGTRSWARIMDAIGGKA